MMLLINSSSSAFRCCELVELAKGCEVGGVELCGDDLENDFDVRDSDDGSGVSKNENGSDES